MVIAVHSCALCTQGVPSMKAMLASTAYLVLSMLIFIPPFPFGLLLRVLHSLFKICLPGHPETPPFDGEVHGILIFTTAMDLHYPYDVTMSA